MEKWCLHSSSFIFDQIIIKVAGNQDRHKRLVEFNFGPNQTTHFGVTCSWMKKISHFWTWISLTPVGQSWSILCVASLGWWKGCVRFWGRLTLAHWTQVSDRCPLGYLLAHLSRRLTRWAYRMGLEPASVRASTLSNMNISETSRPIMIKFYLKHHWGWGKAAGFGADQIRTLVSMATDSSHRVIMGKRASSRFLGCIWSDPFYTCR